MMTDYSANSALIDDVYQIPCDDLLGVMQHLDVQRTTDFYHVTSLVPNVIQPLRIFLPLKRMR